MEHADQSSEIDWLLGDEAAGYLRELAQLDEPIHRAIARLRKSLSADQSRQLVELAELRIRGRQKFAAADAMFFTRTGLEQSTDQWVAAYKARRFAGRESVADLCCGIGGDAVALATEGGMVTAVDFSSKLLIIAAANIQAHGHTLSNAFQQDASDCRVEGFDAWHIDPDRRATGRRGTQLADHSPSQAAIEKLLERQADASIKLAPATQPPESWQAEMELEWISRGGECKQLVAWSGGLVTNVGERRATALSRDGSMLATFASTTDGMCEICSAPGESIYESDAALSAAGLADAVARAYGLQRLGSGASYFTGPSGIQAPLMAEFVIEVQLPLRSKAIAAYVRDQQIGSLEMKQRGTQRDLPKLRKELRLKGEQRATLLLTKIGDSEVAFFAHRADYSEPDGPASERP